MNNNIGLEILFIENIRYLDTDDLVHLSVVLAIILFIIMLTILIVYDYYKYHECVTRITEQYQSAPIEELKKIIKERIQKEGFNCDLNDIDTSLITDMSHLFEYSSFNGNISNWNTSNVKDMSEIFEECPISDNHKPIK